MEETHFDILKIKIKSSVYQIEKDSETENTRKIANAFIGSKSAEWRII